MIHLETSLDNKVPEYNTSQNVVFPFPLIWFPECSKGYYIVPSKCLMELLAELKTNCWYATLTSILVSLPNHLCCSNKQITFMVDKQLVLKVISLLKGKVKDILKYLFLRIFHKIRSDFLAILLTVFQLISHFIKMKHLQICFRRPLPFAFILSVGLKSTPIFVLSQRFLFKF